MDKKQLFSPSTLCLGTVTAAAGECVLRSGAQPCARAALIWGFWQALALVLLCVLAAVALPAQGKAGRVAGAALSLGLLWELACTVWQAQSLCRQQFASSAVIGLVPFLAWLGAKLAPPQFGHAARVLWWLALGATLVCLVGLSGQMHWQRLFECESAVMPQASVYAEYFAFPLLCPRQPRVMRRAVWMPLGVFAVQAGFALGFELLFGGQAGGYAALELLRALSAGAFSRLDSFLLLCWLVLALFRVCFLCAAIWRLRQSTALKRRAEGGNVC